MIEPRDVITMKIPYPSVSDRLAVSAHMYICVDALDVSHSFVKCQSLKPYMLVQETMKHYCDEEPDLRRNPFQKMTRIDCDKLFTVAGVSYDDRMKAKRRTNVSNELFEGVMRELNSDGYETIGLNAVELIRLNPMISSKAE